MARPGAPMVVLDDETPLVGERIDVGVRIGWVLRTARLTAAAPQRRLEDMARALGEAGVRTSAATLHRLETGVLRDARLIEGYEQVLGRPLGALRAPIDAFSRTFPYGPEDRRPWPDAPDLATWDALLAPLLDDSTDAGTTRTTTTGSQWLAWARHAARPGAVALPTAYAEPHVRRLVSELGRSHGDGFMTRYEALSLLRRSEYGALVLDTARDVLAHPHPQALFDLMSAVGESDRDDVDRWLLSLLRDEREVVVAGAVLGLENLAATSGGQAAWQHALPEVVAAYNAVEPGGDAWRWLSHLVRLLPAPIRTQVEAALRHPLSPEPVATTWSRGRLNERWSLCEALAAEVTDELGLPEQPVLARLLFEVAMGEPETRAVTGGMLLAALPAVAVPVADRLARLAVRHDDPVVRERSARRLAGMLYGEVPVSARSWWQQPGELQATGLRLAGASGADVPPEVLRAAAADPDTSRAALYAAGMTRSPVLPDLAADATLPVDARGAAAWWLAQGGRVPA